MSKPEGVRSGDGYRRRRACAECVGEDGKPRTWPTVETTDWRRLARELAEQGRSLEDLQRR